MCWNATVSLGFAVAMFGTIYYLKHVRYSGWQRAAFALSIYGAMQFAQWLNWLTVLPLSNYTGDSNSTCTDANRYPTYLAYVIVQLQAVFNVLAVAVGEPKNRQTLFIFPIIAASITGMVGILQLILGEMNYDTAHRVFRVFGTSTTYDEHISCTYLGPNDYLLWRNKVYISPMMPTYFTYHLFPLTMFFMSNRRQLFIFFVSFYVMAAFSSLSYPNSAESASYWCMTTIVLPLLFIADAKFEQYQNYKKLTAKIDKDTNE
jgi:hypothetical protein